MNVATTIEQSKYLLELGLNPETADMVWAKLSIIDDHPATLMVKAFSGSMQFQSEDLAVPAWSLSALLELIPHTSQLAKDGSYYCEWSNILSDIIDFTTSEYDNPLDAAYEMICWLLENKYL